MATNKNADNGLFPCPAAKFKEAFTKKTGEDFDYAFELLEISGKSFFVAFVTGLTDKNLLYREIIDPLAENKGRKFNAMSTDENDLKELVGKFCEGNIIFYEHNAASAKVIDLKKWDKRAVTVADSENVVRGPKESFTEDIATNISLMRRKLRTANFTVERLVLGKQSNTSVALVYMKDIVNRKILKSIKAKLKRISIDAIMETGQIEQFLDSSPLALLPVMGLTQKPDILAHRILEGRVGILCDGTPHALTIPELFIENFSSAEDYYTRTPFANVTRLLRVAALLISVLVPALAVAILTFHQEMVPFVFLSTFIGATANTPLPFAAEILILILTFELVKEAGTRLPKSIGVTITIVGAMIVGDAAVSAGLVGAPSVIIVALSAVASLLVSNLNEFVTFSKVILLLFAAAFGLAGLAVALILCVGYIASKDSFGIPILSSTSNAELKDSVVLFPLKELDTRPRSIVKRNKTRVG